MRSVLLLVALATVAAVPVEFSVTPCEKDIAKSGADIGAAGLDIKNAVRDCKGQSAAKCTADIALVVSALGSATADVSQAVTDCGATGSPCATDLGKAVSALGQATADVAKAVDDCGQNGTKAHCLEDVIMAAESLGSTGVEIAHAVKDCGGNKTTEAEVVAVESAPLLSAEGVEVDGVRLSLDELYGATASASSVTFHAYQKVGGNDRALRDFSFSCPEDEARGYAQGLRSILGASTIKAFAVVNPRSGEGHAPKDYANTVAPLLTKAGWTLSSNTSTSGHDTKELGKHLDCSAYDVVFTVGGDGTMSKFLGGILGRKDWQDCVKKVVFGIIPSGSGNGLATNLINASGLPFSVESGAFLLSKALTSGYTSPLDITAYQLSNDSTKVGFSMLATEWGLVSDLDEESNFLRWLGPTRFDIMAVIRAIFLRHYDAAISFLPASASPSLHHHHDDPRVNLLPKLEDPVPSTWTTYNGSVCLLYITGYPWIASTAKPAPLEKMDAGNAALVMLKGNATRPQVVEWLLGLGSGESKAKVPETEVQLIKAFRISPYGKDLGSKHLPGHLGLDGDFVMPQTLQGQINHNLVNFVWKKND